MWSYSLKHSPHLSLPTSLMHMRWKLWPHLNISMNCLSSLKFFLQALHRFSLEALPRTRRSLRMVESESLSF